MRIVADTNTVIALTEQVDPESLSEPVCRDPDDDSVLACALTGQADAVVSGDDD